MPETALPKDIPITEVDPASKSFTTPNKAQITNKALTDQQIAELSGFAWPDDDYEEDQQ